MSKSGKRFVQVVVSGEGWTVPFGFGAAYKRCAGAGLDAETTRDIFELVGYTASVETIASWTLFKRVEAEVYCSSVHMRASDNPTPVPPRPEWMGEPWKGKHSGGVGSEYDPNTPTVLT